MSRQIIVFLLVLFYGRSLKAEDAPFPPPPANVSSVVTLVSDGEPGEKLVVRGTVFKEDGKTPYDGFILYLYQTDATGRYNKEDGYWGRPRIRGWIKTDKNGSYEIRTIKPGSYPGSRNPAHIHIIVKLPGQDPDWIDDFLFEGDPFLDPKDVKKSLEEKNFSHIVRAEKRDGVLRCRRDIRIGS